MLQILKRPAAKRDLINIFDYLEEHAGLQMADRFLLAAEKTFHALARYPQSGAPQETIHPELNGLRKHQVHGFHNYIGFYFSLPDGIDLVRVIHGARDLERLFEEFLH